jgi:hypothetical protein
MISVNWRVCVKLDPKVEDGRIRDGYYASKPGMPYGAFKLRGPCGADLAIIIGSAELPEAESWEHVSVSTNHRTPNWIVAHVALLINDSWLLEF